MATYPRKRTRALGAFIAENRAVIDAMIARVGHFDATHLRTLTLSDADRRLWVLNDETLYLWARREGVNI